MSRSIHIPPHFNFSRRLLVSRPRRKGSPESSEQQRPWRRCSDLQARHEHRGPSIEYSSRVSGKVIACSLRAVQSSPTRPLPAARERRRGPTRTLQRHESSVESSASPLDAVTRRTLERRSRAEIDTDKDTSVKVRTNSGTTRRVHTSGASKPRTRTRCSALSSATSRPSLVALTPTSNPACTRAAGRTAITNVHNLPASASGSQTSLKPGLGWVHSRATRARSRMLRRPLWDSEGP
ncbi:hypothetical protein OH76DRAFT_1039624 [Lentinus brumalis]|uniref:Uncharacterized protein n=1 Tax=Lentinus brumalis TaxID=2498619 RepID=A0A371CWZ2_9APHY|nr:hypothetical protein OH76DRAFT_1039624 [Polyporus brumalis]